MISRWSDVAVAGGFDNSRATIALCARVLALLGAWLVASSMWIGAAQGQTADRAASAALRERFAELRAAPQSRSLPQSLYLRSRESPDSLQGDIYALVDHPYNEVRRVLARVQAWCNILILHLNVKYCGASSTGSPDALRVGVGSKTEQSLADAYWMRFTFDVARDSDAYLSVVLEAPAGPLSTRNYLIQVEAAPLDDRRSLVHVGYTYSYGLLARSAMDVYLATLGRGKVGFSVVGQETDGGPIFVGGVRGVVERNTMRYYLAIDAYLGTYALPASQRSRKSLEDWFAATERHPRQLREIDRSAYLAMKEREVRRQESEPAPPRKD